MSTSKKELGWFYTPYTETSKDFGLVAVANKYNQLFSRFEMTGIPGYIQSLTGIPFRTVMVKPQSEDLPLDMSPFCYATDVLWKEAFTDAYQQKRWLNVNRLPKAKSAGDPVESLSIDLIRGLGKPWPKQGVRSLRVEYHRFGLVGISGMGKNPMMFEVGRNTLGDAAFIKQVIALGLGMEISL